MPFRYVIIKTNLNISNYALEQINIRYPVNGDVTMISSSKNLNAVFELTKHTIKATTFSGFFIDGERERKPYEADGYLGQLSQYALNSDYSIARRTQLYLLNNPTWPLEWQMHLIAMAKEDYLRTKDIKYISSIYTELKKRLFLEHIDMSTGLLDANNLELHHTKIKPIIDWPPCERKGFSSSYIFDYKDYLELYARKFRKFLYDIYGCEKLAWASEISVYLQDMKMNKITTNNFVNHAHMYNALRNMQFLAGEIENYTDRKNFTNIANILKETLNNNFFDTKSGFYCDTAKCNKTSFHSNLFAMAFNIVPRDREHKVLDFIYNNKSRASTYSIYYLLKIFFTFNMNKEALNFITKNDTRSWINMIRQNQATNTMESWNTRVKPNLDYTHIWSAHPLYFIIRNIIGIKEPTKDEIIIKPRFQNLSYMQGDIHISNGHIHYSYSQEKNTITYKINKDFNTKIKFVFMDTENIINIELNGNRIKDNYESLNINENNFIIKVQYKD